MHPCLYCGQIICGEAVFSNQGQDSLTCYVLHMVQAHPEVYQP